eukprot:CAMPEP_0114543160 /NCGR_PEP_ID=MMETSP0114-20121206/2210_1 /TAXON_ID=31324 /ORGANISM="Goniomonas sp, Strain m" /LENGTH=239 /DNA_ID=CAMNT_0001727485 /DNA_START=237 /DNA_END=952 /DNA_ORIENTATION=+
MASATNPEPATPGGQGRITCLDVPHHVGPSALAYVSAYMHEHGACKNIMPSCDMNFTCQEAASEMLSTPSVWVRGTCGAQPMVFAFHIAKTPEYVAERDNPIAGDMDSSAHLHSGPEQNNIGHLSVLDRLSSNYQMIECKKVANSAAEVASDPELVEMVNKADLGYKLRSYPRLLTKRKSEMSSMLGYVQPTGTQKLWLPPIIDSASPQLFNVSLPETYDATKVRDCDANAIRDQGQCG